MIKKMILLVLMIQSGFFPGALQAGWDDKFDVQSYKLMEEIEEFQGEYEKQYATFMQLRKSIKRDLLLQKQIAATRKEQRMILLRPKEGIVVKKRSSNNIHEALAWELSYLFHGQEFLVPSFPIDFEGKRIVLQEMEPFFYKKEQVMQTLPKEAKKVSVKEYWKAHFLAYLLGISDLVSQNIGVNPLGRIRFFDLEASLHYENTPSRTTRSFKVGFVSQSLEWPQYREPLDAKTALYLQKFIASLEGVEEKIGHYLACREVPWEIDGMLYRLEKVRNFPLQEGHTFKDFYCFIFPRVGAGLDTLKSIASDILHRKVDHGSAMILISRWVDRYPLSTEQKASIEEWISTYVDPISDSGGDEI